MANWKRLASQSHGRQKRHGWRVQRQESRERIVAPIKFVGGTLLLTAVAYLFFTSGFLLPG